MSRIFRVFSSSKFRLFKSLDSRQLVTVQEIKTFQEQGVVCVRGAFREWVDKLKKGVGANHANPSKDGEWLKSEDSQTFYFNDYFNWRRIPEFEEFVRSSPAAEIAGKLMMSEVCFIHQENKSRTRGWKKVKTWGTFSYNQPCVFSFLIKACNFHIRFIRSSGDQRDKAQQYTGCQGKKINGKLLKDGRTRPPPHPLPFAVCRLSPPCFYLREGGRFTQISYCIPTNHLVFISKKKCVINLQMENFYHTHTVQFYTGNAQLQKQRQLIRLSHQDLTILFVNNLAKVYVCDRSWQDGARISCFTLLHILATLGNHYSIFGNLR